MFKFEIRKLLVKQKMIFPAAALLALSIVFMLLSYRNAPFANSVTERWYNEYLSEFAGKPSDEKTEKVYAEQEMILDAKNSEELLRADLIDGKFESEQEYIEKASELRKITERSDAFDAFLEVYEAALTDPENRFILQNDYSGMTGDIPDVFILGFVILSAAVFFLNEETSQMISLIKIGENGKTRTFFSKISALVLTIFCVCAFRLSAELLLLAPRGNELSLPVQSIEYFCGCRYNVSIIETLFITHALRFLGYLFVAVLVMLLAITLKKPLFTVFVPCAACLLQQFLFTEPSSPAYYLPTGLLRAVGYLRGDDIERKFENTEYELVFIHFKAIPRFVPVMIAALSAAFIAVSLAAAVYHYGTKPRKKFNKLAGTAAALTLCVLLCGCRGMNSENVVFNGNDKLQQNDRYYFYKDIDSGKVMMVNKSDGTEMPIIRDEMDDDKNYTIVVCGDYLYYAETLPDLDVKRISLTTFESENIYLNNIHSSNEYGFLGLKRKSFLPDCLKNVQGYFADGQEVYYIAQDGMIYTLRGETAVPVIDEPFTKMSFDGENIYYINMSLELISHNVKSGEEKKIAGDFVRKVFYDGKRILYMNKNGLFEMPRGSEEARKISGITAENVYYFQSDGANIVYYDSGAMYVLDDSGEPQKSCDLPENVMECQLITGTNKLRVQYWVDNGEAIEYRYATIDMEGLSL